jgi:ribulose 1,5-bisphosphate synthetase/thiazole synthase
LCVVNIFFLNFRCEREAEVIVVGAGLAGLAAAQTLVQAGVDTLLIEGIANQSFINNIIY